MNLLLLIIGFILLIKGADVLVDSSSKLAKLYGIPTYIIGLSIVAFGTSAPELAIGVSSSLKQINQITLGDVIGSCIANIALIIGITAIISPLNVERDIVKKELPLSFGIQLVLLIMILFDKTVSRIEGIIFIVMFITFLYYIFARSKQTHEVVGIELVEDVNDPMQNEKGHKIKLILLFIAGLAALVVGANLVVDSSVNIATAFGLSKTLIGLTVVALGTSLPELVTCVVAAIKKQHSIAIGNIVGSNIFNIIAILGISSAIYPINIIYNVVIDIVIMLISTFLLFAFTIRTEKVNRASGIILLAFYISYIMSKIITI